MILKVYAHIYIVLLIVHPQFGKQSLLAPLIMSGVVRVRVSKSFRLREEFQPPLRMHVQLDIHISWFDCEICFYTGESCKNVLQVRNLELQNALGSKTRNIEH